MKKITILGIFLILAFSGKNSFSECTTTLIGGTVSGQTWTVENSPYCIEGSLIINSLTIGSGVKVQFMGNYMFEVQGRLIAQGTDDNIIIFTGGEEHETNWQGIDFNNSLNGSVLKHCIIEDSIDSGIEIFDSLPYISNCKISNNIGSRGGGIYASLSTVDPEDELIIDNCELDSNLSNVDTLSGGGINANIQSGILKLIGCNIHNNKGYGYCSNDYGCSEYTYGGGIFATGNIKIENCYIGDNIVHAATNSYHWTSHAYPRGNGIYFGGGNLTMINSSITNNSYITSGSNYDPHPSGGGMYIAGGTANLINCAVAFNNKEGINVAGGTLDVVNSILWENTSNEIIGTATVNYSDVQDGYTGEGNIDANPVFFNPPQNLRIDCTVSPCIDAGSNNVLELPDRDIDGQPRVANYIVDIGISECAGPLPDLVANAGPDQVICRDICDGVVLDARKSQSESSQIEYFDWELIHRQNSSYNLVASGETPTVLALEVGIYDVTLIVTDSYGYSESDEMKLTVIDTCNGCAIMKGDLDADGDVDGYDLEIFSGYFGTIPLLP